MKDYPTRGTALPIDAEQQKWIEAEAAAIERQKIMLGWRERDLWKREEERGPAYACRCCGVEALRPLGALDDNMCGPCFNGIHDSGTCTNKT